MRIFILLLSCFVLSFSCKNSSEKESQTENNTSRVKIEHKLIVNVNFKTNKKDVFRIMMNNIEVDELQQKNIQFFEEVFPTVNFENMTVEFESTNFSNNLLINLGNGIEKQVEIKNIVITYGQNEIIASTPIQLNEYFRPNKFVTIDSINNILYTNRVDNQHFPAISLKRSAINYLKKL